MQSAQADWTLTFRRLGDLADPTPRAHAAALPDDPVAPPAFLDAWRPRWDARLADDPRPPGERAAAMRAANPAVIPRNHRVEHALAAAATGDLAPFEALLSAIRRPFDDDAPQRPFMAPPGIDERVLRTFCGT